MTKKKSTAKTKRKIGEEPPVLSAKDEKVLARAWAAERKRTTKTKKKNN